MNERFPPEVQDRPIPGTDPWRDKLARIDAALSPEALKVAGLLYAIERADRAEPFAVEPAPIYRELAHNLMNPAHRAAVIAALQAMDAAPSDGAAA